ncbi:MAG: acetate/propionate family kinase [Candidatus Kaiserbacteria bacterium]|nr:acetate/propionate family kinase [Candidatus Kaiserbacteria bacterium]MCB9816896.1 hypothetical protein [Candidatus Nomurabacteria bacterium]
MGTTLVVNPGSSSRKYALYRDGAPVIELRFEQTNTGFEMCSQISGTQQVCESVKETDFSDAFARVAEAVNGYLMRESVGKRLDSVAVRVVAPGTFFQRHAILDDVYHSKLKRRESAAPLHIPVLLREIKAIQKYFPEVRIIAASDSAFHSDMPPQAREYSIAVADANEFDIHRFGYHGLSVSSIVRRIHPLIGIDPERMIVCHIGNGTSVTAVKNGTSVETTMGFAPSTGVPMGSRAGDVDNAALLELMRVKNLRPREAEMYINNSGGLAGLSGESDIRRLLDLRSQNDATATHTLNTFAYHLQKAIAAQTVALGGLDVLVLTATASVRSSELRSIILSGLTHLGVHVSKDRNDLLVGKDGVVSVRNSAVKVVVMRTDEMGEMAQVAAQFS